MRKTDGQARRSVADGSLSAPIRDGTLRHPSGQLTKLDLRRVSLTANHTPPCLDSSNSGFVKLMYCHFWGLGRGLNENRACGWVIIFHA